MSWNIYNGTILLLSLFLIIMALLQLMQLKDNHTAKYFFGFIVLANLVILQVILIDIGVTKAYPIILLFYLPYQFLSPTIFMAFTCSYIGKANLYKRYKKALLLPFVLVFLAYTFLKINLISDYALLSKETAKYINAHYDENLALAFAMLMGVWDYWIIKNYENRIGNLSYHVVKKKTKWLKIVFVTLIVLCFVWASVILYIHITPEVETSKIYYLIFFLFLGFYLTLSFLGQNHLNKVKKRKEQERICTETIANEFQIKGLNKIFSVEELETSQYEATNILSYFATSLFDKNTKDSVLWDISKNCISLLNLEDCVIYTLDPKKKILIQSAAYGDKKKDDKKILNPIEIPLGKGIVGTVAYTKKLEIVSDTALDSRYIVDDKERSSELAVPIVHENKLLGVIDSEHSAKNFFEEKHLFLLQLIAKLTAAKLQQLSCKGIHSITNDNAYFKEFCILLDKDKIYRNPELSLGTVAKKLNISTNYLSQMVNRLSGSNFSDFVNTYRVTDAKQKLIDPQFSNYTVLSIGLESGFNSKSVFYAAFKKHTGMSPTKYKEATVK
ncbi:helix-turn-helix domain-containing protein [Maribacter sp. 2304DJ31-5]|uniref:helix-turn-helix domain-containing protein n=1 Tax=Maribacter sp. 2304DJ31-5 TaxID=3386273 RepID=UPI0039BD36C6